MATKNRGESSVQTVQEAVAEAIHNARGADGSHIPPKAIAQLMNVSTSVLYDIADEHRDRKLRAAEVPALVKATGSPLVVEVIARACGGVYVSLPPVLGSIGDDYSHASDALEQFGQTMQAYATALSDGRITGDEAQKIDREGHEAIASILALVNHAKSKAGSNG